MAARVVAAAVPAVAVLAAAVPDAARATGGAAAAAAGTARHNPPAFNGSMDAATLIALFQQVTLNAEALDASFLTLTGVLVFSVQTGFAMLTAGSVRSKNVMNVLLKNVLDCCTGALAYYLFGFAFAHGNEGNGILGYSQFALTNHDEHSLAFFFFQWSLTAASSTIVSGAIAERASFYAYLLYSFLITGFMFPLVSHAVWDSKGFLSALNPKPLLGSGMIDFAGSAVVHAVGGLCGFWGAVIIGPRIGRFDVNGKPVAIAGHSASLVVLGSLLLWTGWFGFNSGSMLSVSTPADHELFGGRSVLISTGETVLVSPTLTVTHCLVTTLLGVAASALSGLVLSKCVLKLFDLVFIVNCLLSGLVSITAGCATFEPYVSLGVGSAGAVIYCASSHLMLFLRVDDPVDAVSVHFACGVWGALATGFFSSERLQAIAGYPSQHYGVVYGGDGRLLLCQIIGVVCIVTVVSVVLPALFIFLCAINLLRVSAEQEQAGVDEFYHGGAAYPEDVSISPWDASRSLTGLNEPGAVAPDDEDGREDGDELFDRPASQGSSEQQQQAHSAPLPFNTSAAASAAPGSATSLALGRAYSTSLEMTPALRFSRSDITPHRPAALESKQHLPRHQSLTGSARKDSDDAPSVLSVLHADSSLAW